MKEHNTSKLLELYSRALELKLISPVKDTDSKSDTYTIYLNTKTNKTKYTDLTYEEAYLLLTGLLSAYYQVCVYVDNIETNKLLEKISDDVYQLKIQLGL